MDNRRAILVDEPDFGNQEAIERLRAFAPAGVSVTVLVTPGDVPSVRHGGGDLGEIFVESERRRAEKIAEELKSHGIDAAAKVRVGSRSSEVIREVLETGADYIIKVSGGAPSRRSFVGSTDLRLLRSCPCPVWIARPRDRVPYQRVYAAVDPEKQRPGRDPGLDARILEWAARIARADNAKLTILHAWEMVGESLLLHGRGRIPADEVQQLLQETRDAHKVRVEELVQGQDLAGVDHTLQVVKGRPSDTVSKEVDRGRADLLVMGTVARTGIAGFFIGSTAEEILPQVGCAILAIKPDGFVSPIQGERGSASDH